MARDNLESGMSRVHPYVGGALNKILLDRLKTLFGEVEIARAGEGFRSTREPVTGREIVLSAGEYYRVNCPYCGHRVNTSADTRKRLWINHMWGIPDPESDNRFDCRWHLAICYNENCLSNPSTLRALRNAVYTDYNFAQLREIKILPGEVLSPLDREVTWPGHCLKLTELPYTHPANVYLLGRKFDPAYLSDTYDLRYCLSPSPEHPAAVNRLICPLFMGGKMVTWQARYIGEANWRYVPKYYNLRGAAKSAALYNYDTAKTFPFVVIVEGYFDAWRVGDCAVAILGRTLSETQMNLIKSTWKVAIIALDDDAYYYSEDAYHRLRAYMPVVRVQLPDGYDPADMQRDDFFSLVIAAADREGIDLLNLG